MKNQSIKTSICHVVFYSGFDTESTIKENGKTTYILVDSPSQTKINLTFWQPEGFADDEYALSVEHNGLENLSKTGVKRWERILTKLNAIPNLTVSVEDLREPIFTEEQEKKLDELCAEYDIKDED
jgi:hypothetical protein